jgi:alpha-ketoglutarate-dependent taurine dioxygenase
MSLSQRDLMVRMIQQLAEAFGRVVSLKRAGRLDEAVQLVKETANGLFGPVWDTLQRLEPASAAMMLGSREKVSAYAMLTQHQSELDDLKGDVWKAQAGYRRALELHLEAARLGADVDTATRAAIRTLRPRVDESRLSKSYKVMLDRIAGPR